MAKKQEIDQIVQTAVQQILAMSDSDAVEAHLDGATSAINTLTGLTADEVSHRTIALLALADAQVSWGLNEREALLDELVSRANKIGAGVEMLGEAAENNILVNLSNRGSAVLSVANSLKTLADNLEGAVNAAQTNPASIDTAALSESANNALTAIQGLAAQN